MKNYYQSELDNVQVGEYPLSIKIKGEYAATKWLNINNESIDVLIRYLQGLYDTRKIDIDKDSIKKK